jgi:hypothetical protein
MPSGFTLADSIAIAEARAVLWLRDNRRPLGELLDEGFLTRARLEWAAENAYDVQLKRAAAVLLQHISQEAPANETEVVTAPPSLDAGISIEEARSVAWPFAAHKGQPMGALIDGEQLSLKDLGFAVENAWEDKVRRAAAVLAAVRLDRAVKEPPPPAGPLNVVSGGRSYAQRRESWLTLVAGTVLGASMMLLAVLAVVAVRQALRNGLWKSLRALLGTPVGIAVLLVLACVGAGLGWAFWALPDLATRRLDKTIGEHQRGQEGEDRVVEALARYLDGRWSLFRNVVVPGGRGGDIDMVLVGPPGVFALEVKCYSGDYRNVGDRWEIRSTDGWKGLRKNPSEQANRNASHLGGLLKADGIDQWVKAVVVWAEPSSSLSVENPMVAVWRLERIGEEVGNTWTGQAMDPKTQEQIKEKLTRLCRRQREKQASRE